MAHHCMLSKSKSRAEHFNTFVVSFSKLGTSIPIHWHNNCSCNWQQVVKKREVPTTFATEISNVEKTDLLKNHLKTALCFMNFN